MENKFKSNEFKQKPLYSSSSTTSSKLDKSGDMKLNSKVNTNNYESLFDSGYGSTTHSVNDANIFTSQRSIDDDLLPSISSISTASSKNIYSNKSALSKLDSNASTSSSSSMKNCSSNNISLDKSSFQLKAPMCSSSSLSSPFSLGNILNEKSSENVSHWQDSGLSIDSGLYIDGFSSTTIDYDKEMNKLKQRKLKNETDNFEEEENYPNDDNDDDCEDDELTNQQFKPKYKTNQEIYDDNDKVIQINSNTIDINKSSFILNAYQKNEDGDTLLHLAIIQLMTDLTLELIKRVPHPDLLNITNNLLQTPLHLAIITKQKVIIRHLILSGCKLDIRNGNGDTVLHIACRLNDFALVEMIIRSLNDYYQRNDHYNYDYNKDLLMNVRNYEGETCIHLAVENGHKKLVEYLLSEGANIDAQYGKCGKAALHWAIEEQKVDIAQHLLQRCNATVNIVNYAGLTPLHIAWKMLNVYPNNQRIRTLICLLSECGGEPKVQPSSFDSDNDLSSGDESNDDEENYNFVSEAVN